MIKRSFHFRFRFRAQLLAEKRKDILAHRQAVEARPVEFRPEAVLFALERLCPASPKKYASTSSTIAYLPGFSAPRGRRRLSRSVRLRRLEKELRGRRIDEYRSLFSDQIPGTLLGATRKCGPWTQSPCLCQALRLLEQFDLKEMGHLSADYIHVLSEALKLAFADRDEYYGDPLFADVPMAALLSDVYTQLRRPLIDRAKASGPHHSTLPVTSVPAAEEIR